MSGRNALLLKILLFLFALNSLSLFLYFSSHPSKSLQFNRRSFNPFRRSLVDSYQSHHSQTHLLKPWPILPSYFPWSQTLNTVAWDSCEAYFGNGFTRSIDLISSTINFGSGEAGGWFRCWYSETLRSSICEGGKLRMVPEKIQMAKGGERLEEVIGRTEEDELPVFQNGAFEIDGGDGFKGEKQLVNREFLNRYVTEGEILRHTMRDFISSIRIVGGKDFACDEWIEEPTLMVTRFEYANLFHTVTDWYSAYVSSRVTGLSSRPHLVFIDGHCMTPLEETWKALFSSLRYAKSFSGPVCFRHAILSPLGYETALFKGLTDDIDCNGASAHDLWQNPDNFKTARISEFGEMVRAAFGLPLNRHHDGRPVSSHNVLFVHREDYVAHPRHGGKVESRLSNEPEVFNSLKSWASNYKGCDINLVNGLFARMPMKEQVRAIQDASVIIGAHGAGLTHIISALPKTVILEIISSEFNRPHFALIAQWKGLEYHAIYLKESYANPGVVINELSSIMKNLGC